MSQRRRRIVAAALAAAFALAWVLPGGALACSPPFEPPTIKALGPAQVVVLGTTGERVAGGRVFNVERWFNGPVPSTPILIDFKEGPPVGDCSYVMDSGRALIIAPDMAPDGRLSADLVTLQADPADAEGKAYLEEARRLFGPGIEPPARALISSQTVVLSTAVRIPVVFLVLAVVAFLGAVVVLDRRWRRRRSTKA